MIRMCRQPSSEQGDQIKVLNTDFDLLLRKF